MRKKIFLIIINIASVIVRLGLGSDTNDTKSKEEQFTCTLNQHCKKTEFCSCRDSNNNYGLPCTVIGEFGEVPRQLSTYVGGGQCYHVGYMIKDFVNYSDPSKYVDLHGIVASNITAEEQCKNKSSSSQVTVDPKQDHSPWCQCEPMSQGDNSPWKDFNCTECTRCSKTGTHHCAEGGSCKCRQQYEGRDCSIFAATTSRRLPSTDKDGWEIVAMAKDDKNSSNPLRNSESSRSSRTSSNTSGSTTPLGKEGEGCGPCLCPPTYTFGRCAPGLECYQPNQGSDDVPGVCVKIGYVGKAEQNATTNSSANSTAVLLHQTTSEGTGTMIMILMSCLMTFFIDQ